MYKCGDGSIISVIVEILMEEHLNQFQAAHLLQHTLRSLCINENSLWDYAVFWRVLPRNYPPPNWDFVGGGGCRSRGNRRNWIMVWEDGFCNFAAPTSENIDFVASRKCDLQHFSSLQPEVFFKMSHEIYSFGEGLIGKVAAENSHRWVYKQHNDQEIDPSAWKNSCYLHPKTWKAQFQSGIKTIALIAVKGGVLQLGSINKVTEDLSYVIQLQRKFSYLQTIPGFLLPHPSSSSSSAAAMPLPNTWPIHPTETLFMTKLHSHDHDHDDHFNSQPILISPSMSSLEALLSKLPSVVPASLSPPSGLRVSLPKSMYSHQMPLDQMGLSRTGEGENTLGSSHFMRTT